jgi:superkiller protein 3|tara:strand:- start:1086 stop:2513 length:1428 start_codon:yes stop_codon:yes gene_type:complete
MGSRVPYPLRLACPGKAPRWLLVLAWILVGCSGGDRVGDPVVAGLDAAEPELVEFLDELIADARASHESGLVRGRLGMGYDANGFHTPAEVTYAQAEALDPKDFRWPYFRAIALAQLSRYEEGLASVDRAIAIDPGYASAWLWRGTWLLDLDRHEEAAEAYGRVGPAADPIITAVASAGIARTLMRQGRSDDAVVRLEAAAADYRHPAIMRLLANAYRRVGRIEDMRRIEVGEDASSLTWPDKYLIAKQDYIRGFSGRMLIIERLIDQQKSQAALEMLEPLRETKPNDRRLLNKLSIAYSLAGRSDDAFETLRRGLEVHPDFHLLHYNIAVHYENRGEDQLALQHLNRALELHPGLQAARQRKISLLSRGERLEEALAATDAASRYGADPGVLFYGGLLAGALERWPLAIERFEQALRLDPAVARTHLFLGRSLAEVGRFDDARRALEQAQQMGAETEDMVAARRRLQYLEGQAK